jgi:hypothetical protein
MKEKLVLITILSTIFVRGEMFKVGDEVEVNEREAKELINRGVAADEAEVEIEEDTTKPIEKMNKQELLDYAAELEVEVEEGMTKAQIIEAINAEDEE